MAMVIKQLITNWHSDNEGNENYEIWEPGEKGIMSITECVPTSDGILWHYNIYYDNGNMKRVFNPNAVSFEVE